MLTLAQEDWYKHDQTNRDHSTGPGNCVCQLSTSIWHTWHFVKLEMKGITPFLFFTTSNKEAMAIGQIQFDSIITPNVLKTPEWRHRPRKFQRNCQINEFDKIMFNISSTLLTEKFVKIFPKEATDPNLKESIKQTISSP